VTNAPIDQKLFCDKTIAAAKSTTNEIFL